MDHTKSSTEWLELQRRLAALVEAGQMAAVEKVFEEFPQFRANEQLLVDCITAEFALRKKRRQTPSLEEYLGRFPQLSSRLQFLGKDPVTGGIDSATEIHLLAGSIEGDHAPAARDSAGFGRIQANDQQDPQVFPQLAAAAKEPLKPDLQSENLASGAAAMSGEITQSAALDSASAQRVIIGGRYKLLEQIGQGGMGAVYMAEQAKPVQRLVALKIIKPGMDSREVIARFEAERQAIALMDHPNIAKVFDGGTTEKGQPYFAMELVKGVFITKFCDSHHLSPRERLELFLPVCHAVQHAHQKGIIHRDLKPSNILVAQYDGRPVPKVIDFGVAKATGQKLTDSTMHTAFGAIVGTLEYMSPEQAEFNQLDVDTRSDIYSLGVVLYELLTGTTPFEKKRMKAAALMEILRVIREEEPQRPSTRLSTTDELPSIAAKRGLEPKRLSGVVRGELDWIVMKSLEKDRNRRYETANGLAMDIQRFLSNEPVSACPPSMIYRMRKMASKHRSMFAIGAVFSLLIIAGLIGLVVSRDMILREMKTASLALIAKNEALTVAQDARDRETEQRELAERRQGEAEQQSQRANRNFGIARDAVDRMLTKVADELRGQPKTEKLRQDLLEDALKFNQEFLSDKSDDPDLRFEAGLSALRIGNLYCFLDQKTEGIQSYSEAIAIFSELSDKQPKTARFRERLAETVRVRARACTANSQFDQAIAGLEQSVALWDELARDWPDQPEYLFQSAAVNREIESIWHGRYVGSKTEPYRKRREQLQAEIVKRFPDFPFDQRMHAQQQFSLPQDQTSEDQRIIERSRQARNYSILPHDPEVLRKYEEEINQNIAYWDGQMQSHPGVPVYQRMYVAAKHSLLSVILAQARFDEVFHQAMALHERFPPPTDPTPENQVSMIWEFFGCGFVAHACGQHERAREYFQQSITTAKSLTERSPNEKRYCVHLVGVLIYGPYPDLRDPQLAIQTENRILAMADSNEDRFELAYAQTLAGLHAEALQSLEVALQRTGHNAAHDLVGSIVRLNAGQTDQAKVVYKRGITAIDTTDNKLWYTFQYRFMRASYDERMGIDPATKP